MLSLSADQQTIVASAYQQITWLFEVTDTDATDYHWSTKVYTFAAQAYTAAVLPTSFRGITLNRARSESGIQSPNRTDFQVSNVGNTLTASKFVGQGMTIKQVISDGAGLEEIIYQWKFDVKRCEAWKQKLHFTCVDFVQKYLEGDYPKTPLVKELSASNESVPDDNLCVPLPFYIAYVPLRSVYISGDSARFYVVGESARTHTFTAVHSPEAWPSKSEWTSAGGYAFTQSTKTLDDGNGYDVVQPIIADSNSDGTADANGLWKQGDYFLDPPFKFYSDDASGTAFIGGAHSGTHTGANNDAALDSSGTFVVDALIGSFIVNETDGSYGLITDNAAQLVTATLEGGTDNDWDTNDVYTVGGPASIIRWILLDFGIAAADIDSSSFGAAEKIFTSWNMIWGGALWYKEPRATILARLLNMCHATLKITDKVELHVLLKASQKTITQANIVKGDGPGEGTFSYEPIIQKNSDSGYVAFQESGKPQDRLLKIITPAKSGTANISSEILELPWISDDQQAQKLGTLYYQRKFLNDANISFTAMPNCGGLQPDDVITVNHADYGGSYAVLVDSIVVNKDGSLGIRALRFSAALDDWGDLAPANVTFATDGGTSFWKPVISGPDGAVTSGDIPNVLPGRLRVGATGDHVIIDGDNKRIRSSNYVSGVAGAGFNLDSDLLEVGNISARGTIRTAAFQKDVISAVGGNLMLRPADTLSVDMSTADNSVLTIKGIESLSTDDILRIKEGSTDDEWMKVTDASSAPAYVVLRDQSSGYAANENPAWKKGATVVNYGQSGDGFPLLTASESNSPRISIATHAGVPWTSQTEHLRLGNLNGYLGYSSDIYGIGIGATTAYLKYETVGGMQYVGPVNDRTPYTLLDKMVANTSAAAKRGRFSAVEGLALNTKYKVDTSHASTTYYIYVNLQGLSPVKGDWLDFMDVSRNFGTNKLRLVEEYHRIEGHGATDASTALYVDCTWDRCNFRIVYTGSTYGWKIV